VDLKLKWGSVIGTRSRERSALPVPADPESAPVNSRIALQTATAVYILVFILFHPLSDVLFPLDYRNSLPVTSLDQPEVPPGKQQFSGSGMTWLFLQQVQMLLLQKGTGTSIISNKDPA
jgi:hypothetical protein